MNSISKTLYIPLCGKAYVSRKGVILHDPKAETIWNRAKFPLRPGAQSRWLAYYLAMRAAVYDAWVTEQLTADPSACVVHIGCGLDSRCERVASDCPWFDVDLPDVIDERRLYYEETPRYRMIAADVTQPGWMDALPGGNAVIVMEGVSMYLPPDGLKTLLAGLAVHFDHAVLLVDYYTARGAKLSSVRNPIHAVGAGKVYGYDKPEELALGGFTLTKVCSITPSGLIAELNAAEAMIFRALYGGRLAAGLYAMAEYATDGAYVPKHARKAETTG